MFGNPAYQAQGLINGLDVISTKDSLNRTLAS
jgi:hypothetical protein